MLTIVPFETKYTQNFKDLNIAWITEYFIVEDKDRELLETSQYSIIDKGGYIFMGLWKNEPGQKLLMYAIGFAKNKNWDTLELYSSTKLDTALHIYKKYGFINVPLEDNLEYLRSDIKMELTL